VSGVRRAKQKQLASLMVHLRLSQSATSPPNVFEGVGIAPQFIGPTSALQPRRSMTLRAPSGGTLILQRPTLTP